MRGFAIPASFIFAEATDFSGGGAEADVLAYLLGEAGTSAVTVDGSDAVRSDLVIAGVDETSGFQLLPVRQIVYTVAIRTPPVG